MLMIRERLGAPAPPSADLCLPYDLREKHRLLTRLSTGEAVGLALGRGAPLRDGECLRAEDGRVVRVVAAEEELLEVRSDDAQLLARIAFHLGNRHTRVQVGPGWLRFATDAVQAALVQGLGAMPIALRAPFDPEGGAYPGTHTHAPGDGETSRGVIHDMIDRVRR
jgi:urease accessory protein